MPVKTYLLFFFLLIPCLLQGQIKTEKSRSVALSLLGAEYNQELPLNDRFTVNLHGGLSGELGYYAVKIGSWYDDDGWIYSLRGVVGADFRYYYNLNKRAKKGKSTFRNSGNFWAVDLRYLTPAFAYEGIDNAYMLIATPYWGIRRVYKSNLYYELNLGLNVGVIGDEWGVGGASSVKFGYTF